MEVLCRRKWTAQPNVTATPSRPISHWEFEAIVAEGGLKPLSRVPAEAGDSG